jgi:hypothetical protein
MPQPEKPDVVAGDPLEHGARRRRVVLQVGIRNAAERR